MKKSGFSLLELIVCIGVLAILSSFVTGQFSKSMMSARNATCLANMRSLALAFGQNTYPSYTRAGPYVCYNTEMGTAEYQYKPGWLSWYSPVGNYVSSVQKMHFEPLGAYYNAASKEDQERHLRCLDKGAIWDSVKHSQNAYLCPLHGKAVEKQSGGKLRPMWSYVLNGWYMWEVDDTPMVSSTQVNAIKGRTGSPNYRPSDMVMVFAELQMEPLTLVRGGAPSVVPAIAADYSVANDGILQYQGCDAGSGAASNISNSDDLTDGGEIIGFNHVIGNKKVAHVAFLDGHVEQISLPINATLENLRELTRWLCLGLCYTQEGNAFRLDELDK